MSDLIDRQYAIATAISGRTREIDGERWIRTSEVRESLKRCPSAQPDVPDRNVGDMIGRQAAIDALSMMQGIVAENGVRKGISMAWQQIEDLPSAQPEKEKAKHVLWSGWKGDRDTRYYCPNCKKIVRNDDVYCHRCGQRLMFPKVSHTPYVEGQKQELIVRWDDEE